jgi:hypothetical protein
MYLCVGTAASSDSSRVVGPQAAAVVTPILVGQRQPPKPGLRPEDLYANEFIDPSIGKRL